MDMEQHVVSAQMTLEVVESLAMGMGGEGHEETTSTFVIMKVKPSQPGKMILSMLENNKIGWLTPTPSNDQRFEFVLKLDDAVMEEPDSPFAMIWDAIEQHYRDFPQHGHDCTCMDKYIRDVRAWMKSPYPESHIDRSSFQTKCLRSFKYIVAIASRW